MAVATGRKLYLADLAELAGVEVKTLRAYRARGAARLPEPDGIESDRGHARPWWGEEKARAWLAARPGRGRWGRDST